MLLSLRIAARHSTCARAFLLTSAALMLTACGGGKSSNDGLKITAPPAPDPYAPVTTDLDFPTDTITKYEYESSGAQSVDAETIWKKGYNGKGVLIGMIDTGADLTHVELKDRIDSRSRDFDVNGPLDRDGVGHGTQVAGIMVANRNKLSTVGIAYGATLLVGGTEICKSDGTCGGIDLGRVVKSMELMVENKARVVNQSITKVTLPKADADITAKATAQGMIVITSAGNEGGIMTKGKFDMLADEISHGLVIHVGALDSSNKLAKYSDRPGDEGIAKYHFICAKADNSTFSTNRPGSPSIDLISNGTSMAAPVITASIALIIQAWPKLPSKDVVDLVFRTADDLGDPGVDGIYGWGKINLVRAFSSVGKSFFAGLTTSYDPAQPTGFGGPAWGNGLSLVNSLNDIVYTDSYQRDFKTDLGKSLFLQHDRNWLANSLQNDAQSSNIASGAMRISYSFGQSPVGFDRATEAQDQRDLRAGYAPDAMRSITATWQASPQLALGFSKGAQNILPQALGLSIAAPALLAADAPDVEPALRLQGQGALAVATKLHGWQLGAFASRAQSARSELRWGVARSLNNYSLHALRHFGAWTSSFSLHLQKEQGAMMGLASRNILGLQGATHLRASQAVAWQQGPWQVRGEFSQGLTHAQLGTGLVQNIQGLRSQGWRASLTRTSLLHQGDQLHLGVAQPMRISGGHAWLRVPTAWDMESRTAEFTTRHVHLAPDGQERDMELAYSLPLAIGTLDLNLVYRQQPGHVAHAPDDQAVALRWSSSF